MEEVIRKYFQCWLDKDIDAVKEIFSDDTSSNSAMVTPSKPSTLPS